MSLRGGKRREYAMEAVMKTRRRHGEEGRQESRLSKLEDPRPETAKVVNDDANEGEFNGGCGEAK